MPEKYKELNDLLDENGDGIVKMKRVADDALNILRIAKNKKIII